MKCCREKARQRSTAIKIKMHVGEESIDCSADSTWESGLPQHHHHHHPTHTHTPLLPVCISWLIGFEAVRERDGKRKKKLTARGECLGMLGSDVWQKKQKNEKVRSWKWSRGVSSTWRRLIGPVLEVIFSGSVTVSKTFLRLLIPRKKWTVKSWHQIEYTGSKCMLKLLN